MAGAPIMAPSVAIPPHRTSEPRRLPGHVDVVDPRDAVRTHRTDRFTPRQYSVSANGARRQGPCVSVPLVRAWL